MSQRLPEGEHSRRTRAGNLNTCAVATQETNAATNTGNALQFILYHSECSISQYQFLQSAETDLTGILILLQSLILFALRNFKFIAGKSPFLFFSPLVITS